jgi:CO/xanthine dehydrogenase FAD-binding subunit
MLGKVEVYTPRSLSEALTELSRADEDSKIIAGGTDMIIQLKDRLKHAGRLINIYGLDELRYIRMNGGYVKIGALTTYTNIIKSPLTIQHAPILVESSGTIGGIQMQNRGTIGGNLGNASPAADSLPPLYALEAIVTLTSLSSSREVPVEQFMLGPRKTALKNDEIITEVKFRPMNDSEKGAFLKLGLRESNAISVVSAAIWASISDSTFKEIRIALGAVAPTVVRCRNAEQALIGKRWSDGLFEEAAQEASKSAKPISDIRGSAQYRTNMVKSLVYQGLWEIREKVANA